MVQKSEVVTVGKVNKLLAKEGIHSRQEVVVALHQIVLLLEAELLAEN